jgi:hypothetical protein
MLGFVPQPNITTTIRIFIGVKNKLRLCVTIVKNYVPSLIIARRYCIVYYLYNRENVMSNSWISFLDPPTFRNAEIVVVPRTTAQNTIITIKLLVTPRHAFKILIDLCNSKLAVCSTIQKKYIARWCFAPPQRVKGKKGSRGNRKP